MVQWFARQTCNWLIARQAWVQTLSGSPLFPYTSNVTHFAKYWLVPGADLSMN